MLQIKKGLLALTILMASSQSHAILPEDPIIVTLANKAYATIAPQGAGMAILTALSLVTPPTIPVISAGTAVLTTATAAYVLYSNNKK